MLFEPSTKKQDSGLSLIPLINIVFLLLLFFLVSGSWRESVERVSLPSSDQPLESLHDGVAVVLTSDGTWHMAGQTVTLPQLTQQLQVQGAGRINIYADEAAAASSLLALLAAMESSSQLFLIVRRSP